MIGQGLDISPLLKPTTNLAELDALMEAQLRGTQMRRLASAFPSSELGDIAGPYAQDEMYQQIGGHLTAPEDLEPIFQEAAQQTGVDARVLKAIANQESRFNPTARSKAGAMGVMQLMPKTAQFLGVKNPYDPRENIMGGARYFAQMLKQFNNNIDLALAAYNAGPGNVRKYGGIPPFAETQKYVRQIRNGNLVSNVLQQMNYR